MGCSKGCLKIIHEIEKHTVESAIREFSSSPASLVLLVLSTHPGSVDQVWLPQYFFCRVASVEKCSAIANLPSAPGTVRLAGYLHQVQHHWAPLLGPTWYRNAQTQTPLWAWSDLRVLIVMATSLENHHVPAKRKL